MVSAELGLIFPVLKLERCSVQKPLDVALDDPSIKVRWWWVRVSSTGPWMCLLPLDVKIRQRGRN